jgi:LacI family transcriptional regulator
MATIYEVSKLAGVSLATVSRVLNKNVQVSEKTKEKVLRAIKTLDYRPNSIAQSLASNRTNSVGILVSELSGPFFGHMMAAIEEELRMAGKHVIITAGHSIEDREKDGIEFLISRNCDAIIAYAEAVSDDYLIELDKGKIPVYLISRYVDELKDKCVSLDNELGGYLATKKLIECGHTAIAYITGPHVKADSQNRLLGHKRALQEHNIDFNEQLVYIGNYRESGGSEGLEHFIKQGIHFTAIVCANDIMAFGSIKYARESGYNLPEDLSIMGFDNISFTNYLYPTLTTINNPVKEMGHMAAKLVLKDIYQQQKLVITHIFEPSTVIRNSVANNSQ